MDERYQVAVSIAKIDENDTEWCTNVFSWVETVRVADLGGEGYVAADDLLTHVTVHGATVHEALLNYIKRWCP